VFKIAVKYLWFNSPHKEYTVSVYSKQTLTVLDDTGSVSIKHMDGSVPSGFTGSSYKGMTDDEVSTNNNAQ